MSGEQLDIEDAIRTAAGDPTVRQYADHLGVSVSTVRRAIEAGYLEVSDAWPMRIIGGEMPMTLCNWKRAIDVEVRRLRRGVYGFDDAKAELHILDRSGRTHVFGKATLSVAVEQQLRAIAKLNCARRDEPVGGA